MNLRFVHLTPLVVALATAATAQQNGVQVRLVTNPGVGNFQGQEDSPDLGVAVRMFESPTLDRFVRKAHDFLGREDYAGAIKVLQDVLEGQVQASTVEEGETPAESPEGSAEIEDDPAHAVFSGDGRLYRPVRRLCQELLASLPGPGLALYREMYEVAAERELRAAMATRDVRGLIGTYERYFVTLSAARALYAAGELLMHQGRFRSAVQVYRTLLDVYPSEHREQIAGLEDIYIDLKIALCFAAMGEQEDARERFEQLPLDYPEAMLRLRGELVSVSELPARFAATAGDEPPPEASDCAVLESLRDGLVPVWQYRFVDPEPYRRPSGSSNPRFIVSESGAPAAPWYNRHKPGQVVRFEGDELVFLDHYRMRVHDLGSGLVRSTTDGNDHPPKPRQGKARVRIPVYDHVSARVASDARNYYCVLGPQSRNNLPDLEPLLRNNLVAYDRDTMKVVWSSAEWKDGPDGYEDVTFLATPTVFGQRLLVPVLVRGAYAVQGLSARDGSPLFRVHLHSGGTELARAPAVPVVVGSGSAFVATNSGTIGAIDAFTGDLQWVRRYERLHPLRPARRPRSSTNQSNQFARQYFRHVSLPGFVPSDLIVMEGRVLVAPSDGEVFLCLDGATGDILWLLSKPSGSDVHVVGHNSRYLFLGGPRLICVDLRSGIRVWEREFPEPAWTGRGIVTENRIVIPGTRCLYSTAVEVAAPWRKIELPTFSVGLDPLSGPANLFADGPYLVASYEGGIEVFASLEALHDLAEAADDPAERGQLLIRAGDLMAAIDVLAPLVEGGPGSGPEHKKLVRQLLGLVRDVVLRRAKLSARDEALALLDRARPWMTSKDLLLQWQLLRLELFQVLRDRPAVQREQRVLYQIMEGRG